MSFPKSPHRSRSPSRTYLSPMKSPVKAPFDMRDTQDDDALLLKTFVMLLAHKPQPVGCDHGVRPNIQYKRDGANIARYFVMVSGHSVPGSPAY